MLSLSAQNKLNKILSLLSKVNRSLVIDADTHPTDIARLEGSVLKRYRESVGYYQGRPISHEELLKEMNAANVDMALTWQNPAALIYNESKGHNFEKLLQANQDIFDFSERYEHRFIPAGWTDPSALGIDNALKLVDICVRQFGFPIVKMNPAQNGYMIDSEEVVVLINRIVELGATPALHFGGDTPFTPASGLKKLALLHPNHPIIAVHMGGGGSHYIHGDDLYIETRELGLKHPNIFFILSAKRDCHIESALIQYALAGAPFSNNLACGSDAPYGKVAWNFGGFDFLFKSLRNGQLHPDLRLQKNPELFSNDLVQGFLGGNLAGLVVKSCKEILHKSQTLQLNAPTLL